MTSPPLPASPASDHRRRREPMSAPPTMVPTPKSAMSRPTVNWLIRYRVAA